MKNRIKELRNKLGMTLEDFGKSIGRDKATIYRWENQERGLKSEDAKLIADKYNVSITWLVGYEAPPTEPLTTEQLSLIAMFSLLTEQEQLDVIRYISNIIMRRSKQ